MSEKENVLGSLSDAMKRTLSSWKFRYLSADNKTMKALAKRGLVEWVRPGFGDLQCRWITTAAGNKARSALTKLSRGESNG